MGFTPADLATAAKAAALFAAPTNDVREYLTYARLTYEVRDDMQGMAIRCTNSYVACDVWVPARHMFDMVPDTGERALFVPAARFAAFTNDAAKRYTKHDTRWLFAYTNVYAGGILFAPPMEDCTNDTPDHARGVFVDTKPVGSYPSFTPIMDPAFSCDDVPANVVGFLPEYLATIAKAAGVVAGRTQSPVRWHMNDARRAAGVAITNNTTGVRLRAVIMPCRLPDDV